VLVINKLPVIVHCDACGMDAEIEGVQSFRCPRCGELAADLRQGRELEIDSIELDEPGPNDPDSGAPGPVEERL